MSHADFCPILASTFSWLTPAEVAEVASRLFNLVNPDIPARKQMLLLAEALDETGLRVTAPLLMSLAGRGSKTAAVEVVQEISRQRFDKMRTANADPQARPSAAALAALVDPADLSAMIKAGIAEALSSGATAPAALDRTELDRTELALLVRECFLEASFAQAPAIAADDLQKLFGEVRQIAGNVTWLKTMIDTERQLRRYHDKFGPLDEPKPRVNAQTEDGRRAIISELTSHMAQSNYREGAPAPRPTGAVTPFDAACEGGNSHLDM